MTDERREAAESWVDRSVGEDWWQIAPNSEIRCLEAHLAGQEHAESQRVPIMQSILDEERKVGEQRAVERIVAKMRDRAEVWGGTTYCALNDMADEIERGEWR